MRSRVVRRSRARRERKEFLLGLVLLFGSALPLYAQTDSASGAGSFRLHKFEQPIGEEHYRLVSDSAGRTLTTAFEFTDRGSKVPLAASLTTARDGTPRHFEIKGQVSRFSAINETVDFSTDSATVRVDSVSHTVARSGPVFPIGGYAPVAIQQELLSYWSSHGHPDTLETLPGGQVRISRRGVDTVKTDSGTVALTRYGVQGLIWGRETVWLDDTGRLDALVSIDAEFDHFEAMRYGFEPALGTLVASAAADGATALAELRGTPPAEPRTLALVGATLIRGTDSPPVKNSVVIVRDGRVAAAGPRSATKIPRGATIVDVTGKTVLPGLWDMHAHYEQVEWGPIYLAAGVTTARDVGNEFEFITGVRDAIRSGRGIGPRLLLAGVIDGMGPLGLGVARAGTAEEGVQWVHRYHDAGFQQIKIYSSITLPVLTAIAAEAHRLGMTVTGHVPEGITTVQGVEAGMDQINHVQYILPMMRPPVPAGTPAPALDLESPEAKAALAFLKLHHTVVDPTIALFEWVMHPARVPMSEFEPGVLKVAPELAGALNGSGVPPAAEARAATRFAEYLSVIGALHRAGIPIVAGTDQTVPGYSLHRELELYVKAGFSPLEAIQAATIVPARAMHLDAELGTVVAGKRADLLVVEGNPLEHFEDLRKVFLVVTNGHRYEPAPLWRSAGFTP
ncbi:MAG: amidohydrolase family protein [Gemmatimonadota bacterium]